MIDFLAEKALICGPMWSVKLVPFFMPWKHGGDIISKTKGLKIKLKGIKSNHK